MPAEKVNLGFLSPMNERFSESDLQARLPIMDPKGAYRKFLQFSGAQIQVAKDFTSQSIPDFSFDLNQAVSRPSLRDRIASAAKNGVDIKASSECVVSRHAMQNLRVVASRDCVIAARRTVKFPRSIGDRTAAAEDK